MQGFVPLLKLPNWMWFSSPDVALCKLELNLNKLTLSKLGLR